MKKILLPLIFFPMCFCSSCVCAIRPALSSEQQPLHLVLEANKPMYNTGEQIYAWLDLENVSSKPAVYLDATMNESIMATYLSIHITDDQSNVVTEVARIIDPPLLEKKHYAILVSRERKRIPLGSLNDTNSYRHWNLQKGVYWIKARFLNDCSVIDGTCKTVESESVSIQVK